MTFIALNLLIAEVKANSLNVSQDSYNSQLCIKHDIDPTSQQCADLIKQSQLKSEKLSPQIRSTDIKQDKSFHMSELSPFIGGSSSQVD